MIPSFDTWLLFLSVASVEMPRGWKSKAAGRGMVLLLLGRNAWFFCRPPRMQGNVLLSLALCSHLRMTQETSLATTFCLPFTMCIAITTIVFSTFTFWLATRRVPLSFITIKASWACSCDQVIETTDHTQVHADATPPTPNFLPFSTTITILPHTHSFSPCLHVTIVVAPSIAAVRLRRAGLVAPMPSLCLIHLVLTMNSEPSSSLLSRMSCMSHRPSYDAPTVSEMERLSRQSLLMLTLRDLTTDMTEQRQAPCFGGLPDAQVVCQGRSP